MQRILSNQPIQYEKTVFIDGLLGLLDRYCLGWRINDQYQLSLTKKQLICMLASTAKERDFYKLKHDALGAIIVEGRQAIERSRK